MSYGHSSNLASLAHAIFIITVIEIISLQSENLSMLIITRVFGQSRVQKKNCRLCLPHARHIVGQEKNRLSVLNSLLTISIKS